MGGVESTQESNQFSLIHHIKEPWEMTYKWLVSLAASLGGLLFGYEIGVIGQVVGMSGFQRAFGLVPTNASTDMSAYLEDTDDGRTAWVVASFLFGSVLGSLLVGGVVETLGHKYAVVCGSVVVAVGALVQATAGISSQSLGTGWGLLIGGRVVAGVALGVVSMVIPLYLADTAAPHSRHALTSVYQLMITVGIFAAVAVNAALVAGLTAASAGAWRGALAAPLVPALGLAIVVTLIPSPPRWLCERGRHDDAILALARLRGTSPADVAVRAEYNDIVQTIKFEHSVALKSWADLLRKHSRKHLLIAVLNQSFQQLSAINIFFFYSAAIFNAMRYFDDKHVLVSLPLASATVNLLATFPGIWAVDYFKRRPLLILGSCLMFLAHALVFAFLTASSSSSSLGFAWAAVAAIYLFIAAFAITWGPVVWAYQAELFPLRIRAKASAVATAANWTWNALLALAFPHVLQALNYQPTVY
ncbi:hypothetical protein HK100_002552, partial [Physocladia obscura]